MSEHDIQNEIIEYLRSLDMLVIRINSGMRGVIRFYLWWAGKGGASHADSISDLLCLDIDGRFIALEVKQLGEVATPGQEYFLLQVRRRGGTGAVVYNLDEVKRIITREVV